MTTPPPDRGDTYAQTATTRAPAGTVTTAGPVEPATRYDDQRRRLCGARRSNGLPCRAPAMNGQRVCRSHGGSAPQARAAAVARLDPLTEEAVNALAHVMVHGATSAARLHAAESILDRAGGSRSVEVDDDARALLLDRLVELRPHLATGGEPDDDE